jgi:hypothetical protein
MNLERAFGAKHPFVQVVYYREYGNFMALRKPWTDL